RQWQTLRLRNGRSRKESAESSRSARSREHTPAAYPPGSSLPGQPPSRPWRYIRAQELPPRRFQSALHTRSAAPTRCRTRVVYPTPAAPTRAAGEEHPSEAPDDEVVVRVGPNFSERRSAGIATGLGEHVLQRTQVVDGQLQRWFVRLVGRAEEVVLAGCRGHFDVA